MKKLLLIVLTTSLCLLGKEARAQEAEFDTTYNIEYSVDNSLVVSVKEDVSIINQTASAVPSSFIETVTNISIYDIKVADSKDREITPEVTEKEKSLIIKIPVDNPAIGKDKRTQITLSYKTRDLAQKTGRILTLTIPKAPVSNYMQEYNVAIKIPKDFGPQISVTPKPVQEKMEEEGYVLLYNKQTLEQYGISASFGDYQIFDFEIGDQLRNDSFFTRTMELVLPPPIKDYQEVSLTEVSPTPVKLKKDADGNILAVYKVSGRSTLEVKVKGKAKVYNKKTGTNVENSTDPIPRELSKYLKSQNYWETNNPLIKDIANLTKNPLEVYTYLTKNISYDYEAATQGKITQRKGAVQTLIDKKGLCLDFTDAFIALARASGIPAREINGYAYTKDQKATPGPLGEAENAFLHSWAQYYHPKYGWVSVDPTWGTTSGLDYFSKLDNNHLALVIRGIDSQSPQPPKNIHMDFSGDDFFTSDSNYDLSDLPEDGWLTVNPLPVVVVVLALGMCTMFLVLQARSKGR